MISRSIAGISSRTFLGGDGMHALRKQPRAKAGVLRCTSGFSDARDCATGDPLQALP